MSSCAAIISKHSNGKRFHLLDRGAAAAGRHGGSAKAWAKRGCTTMAVLRAPDMVTHNKRRVAVAALEFGGLSGQDRTHGFTVLPPTS